jgi:hypothetical protein
VTAFYSSNSKSKRGSIIPIMRVIA